MVTKFEVSRRNIEFVATELELVKNIINTALNLQFFNKEKDKLQPCTELKV